MSDVYHIAAIDGKLIYEGDESKYIITGSQKTLQDTYKVYNFGPNGYCFHNDTASYVHFPMVVKPVEPFSIACYVMAKSSRSGTIDVEYAAPIWDETGGVNFSIQLKDISDTRIGCRINGTNYTIASNISSQYNTWYHLMLTKDRSNVWRFFVDGKKVGQVTNGCTANVQMAINPYDVWNSPQMIYMNDAFITGTCLFTEDFGKIDITGKVDDIAKKIGYFSRIY